MAKEEAYNLQIAKVVCCRVRYFCDGVVLESRSFVDGVFNLSRKKFGSKRETGAQKPRGALTDLAGGDLVPSELAVMSETT